MDDGKLRIPKPHLDLMLVHPGSRLNRRIGEFIERRDAGEDCLAELQVIQEDIRKYCQQYSPCTCEADGSCHLCRSGENGREPFRGRECRKCRVSQLSRSGVFVGRSRPTGV